MFMVNSSMHFHPVSVMYKIELRVIYRPYAACIILRVCGTTAENIMLAVKYIFMYLGGKKLFTNV